MTNEELTELSKTVNGIIETLRVGVPDSTAYPIWKSNEPEKTTGFTGVVGPRGVEATCFESNTAASVVAAHNAPWPRIAEALERLHHLRQIEAKQAANAQRIAELEAKGKILEIDLAASQAKLAAAVAGAETIAGRLGSRPQTITIAWEEQGRVTTVEVRP